MPETLPRSAARFTAPLRDRAADVRARKARIRPAVTWGQIAARTPSGYAESTVRVAANLATMYPEPVLAEIETALDQIEAEREAEREAA